jgi:flagella basal body P-ring formation protein FlgA
LTAAGFVLSVVVVGLVLPPGACAARVGPSWAAPRAPVALADVTIEQRPRVSVDQPRVRLGDIAYFTTSDLTLLHQLRALPLGRAPRPGSPVLLDRETVARWVASRSPGLSVEWRGATQTYIESESQWLPGESIVNAARNTLQNWLAERSARAEVEPASMPADLTLPAGATSLRVRPLAPEAIPSRRMPVWVDVWVNDRFVRSAVVSFEVRAWTPLPVATAHLGLGAVLEPVVYQGSFRAQEVDLTAIRAGKPVPPEAGAATLDGAHRLRRPLHAGEVLTSAHVEAVPAVLRGGWADLVSRGGAVSIESRVEVLQDGQVGEVVRVKVPGASGEVLAVVTGPGRVKVNP